MALSGRKLIMVLPTLQLGGSERQALMLARHLKDRHEAHVRVWGLGPPGIVSETCESEQIPWRSIHWPRSLVKRLLFVFSFAMQLRMAKPDLLLPYTMVPNVLCGLLWRLVGAKSCVWNRRDVGIGLTKSPVKRLAVHLTPCFVSNTMHGARRLATLFDMPIDRIAIVRNGVVLEPALATPAEWRARLAVDQERLLVGMVANLTPYKDHDTLLRAWKLVVEKFCSEGTPLLVLAGRWGPTYPALRALAEELGIEETTRFLGVVKDISGLLSVLHIGVLSSRMEGCPNAILEYMAACLPVVATDIPSIRETLEGQGRRFLARSGDPKALSDHLVTLLLDPQLRRLSGKENRRFVQQEFSLENMYSRMVQILTREVARIR